MVFHRIEPPANLIGCVELRPNPFGAQVTIRTERNHRYNPQSFTVSANPNPRGFTSGIRLTVRVRTGILKVLRQVISGVLQVCCE